VRYFQKIAEYPDEARRLRAELDEHPELWGQFGWRKQSLEAHRQMTDIWVRFNRPELAGKPEFVGEHDSIWYPAFDKLRSLRHIIFPLMCEVEGERIGGVLITRIPPGEGIAPHVDRSWHVEYYDKFYVSLQSAPGAKFICHGPDGAGEVLEPKPGECWRFDNRLWHSVRNDSAEDRITLIVCIRTEKYQGPYVRAA
jgi:hypothetical protein